MENQAVSQEPQHQQDRSARDAIGEPIQLGMRAFQAALNLQWEPAQKLNEMAQAKANALEGREGELVRGVTGALSTMVEGFALQFRDTDPERFQRAVQRFEGARDQLQELRSQFPGETANADFELMINGMELQAIWAGRRIAREQGDRQQVLIRDAQVKALIETIPEEYKRQLQGMVATFQYMEAIGRIKDAAGALITMDLARALRIIAEVRKEIDDTLTVIRPSLGKEVLFQGVEQTLTGANDQVEGLEGYVRALHDAVVGDVTRAHVDQLTRAEELLRSGASKMVAGMMILNQPSEQDPKGFEGQVALVRNLRALCQESLKPRHWIASASLKFVVVFLVTVIVLVAVTALTDSANGIGIFTGYVLLVSVVVGLIGGFGFEALRFLPFVRLLSRSSQTTEESSEESVDV